MLIALKNFLKFNIILINNTSFIRYIKKTNIKTFIINLYKINRFIKDKSALLIKDKKNIFKKLLSRYYI